MERIKGIDTDGNYLCEDDSQLDQEIQKATNENFLDMIGEDSDDKLISLNKACEWLKLKYEDIGLRWMRDHDSEDLVEQFKKAMEE